MARTKQTARKSSDVKCVQCRAQLERVLVRYSALQGKLVPSQRCADCQNCVFQCLDYKISILDENLCAMSKEDRGLTSGFDFDGFYEINDSLRKSVGKKFNRVHGESAWQTFGRSSDENTSDGDYGWQHRFQRAKRVQRVHIANELKRKWMLKTFMKTQNKKPLYKNVGGRAWLSSQQGSVAFPRKR